MGGAATKSSPPPFPLPLPGLSRLTWQARETWGSWDRVNERCPPEPGSETRQAGVGGGAGGRPPRIPPSARASLGRTRPAPLSRPGLSPPFSIFQSQTPRPQLGLMERFALPSPPDECCHSGWKQARRGRSIKGEHQIVFGVFYSDAVIDCWWGLMPALAAHGKEVGACVRRCFWESRKASFFFGRGNFHFSRTG